MTVELNIKHDLKRLRKQLRTLPDKAVKPTTNRALNRAGKKVHTEAVREISKRTGIKPQRKVRNVIKLTRSSFRTLRAKVTAFRYAPNLIEFVAPSKRVPGAFKKKKGVTAKAWGQKKEYKGTFIGRGRNSGKALVFKRTSDKSAPIRTVSGPSVRRTFIERTVNKMLRSVGRETFIKEFRSDAEYRIHKHLNKNRKR